MYYRKKSRQLPICECSLDFLGVISSSQSSCLQSYSFFKYGEIRSCGQLFIWLLVPATFFVLRVITWAFCFTFIFETCFENLHNVGNDVDNLTSIEENCCEIEVRLR